MATDTGAPQVPRNHEAPPPPASATHHIRTPASATGEEETRRGEGGSMISQSTLSQKRKGGDQTSEGGLSVPGPPTDWSSEKRARYASSSVVQLYRKVGS